MNSLGYESMSLSPISIGFEVPGIYRTRRATDLIDQEIIRIQDDPPTPLNFLENQQLKIRFLKNSLFGIEENFTPEQNQLLLTKIHKIGNNPSITGLSLSDAKALEKYINRHKESWKIKLNIDKYISFAQRMPTIKIKKSVVHCIPRSLEIGLETDGQGVYKVGPDGEVIMRIMVLCKNKMTHSEIHTGITDPLKTVKVHPIGRGSYKTVKSAVDWITGELFVQIIVKDSLNSPNEAFNEVSKEFLYMNRLAGYPGIAKPGFMRSNFTKSLYPPINATSYFMPRYKSDLHKVICSNSNPFSFKIALKRIDNLADSLLSYFKTETIYCDSKTSNTLVDENGVLYSIDNGLAITKNDYIQNLELNRVQEGTYDFLAPEIINAFCTKRAITELKEYPYARDVWATGLQCLYILASGNNHLLHQVDGLGRSMRLYRYEIDYVSEIIHNTQLKEKYEKDPYCLEIQKYRDSIYQLQLQTNKDLFLSLDVVYDKVKKREILIHPVNIETVTNKMFESFANTLLYSIPKADFLMARELIIVVKKMLRAEPKNRISSLNLKRDLIIIKSMVN